MPEILENLLPKWSYLKRLESKKVSIRKSRKNCDKRHRARPLADIPNDQPVWVNTDGRQQQSRTVSTTEAPRSYLVRRNRQQLISISKNSSTLQSPRNNTSTDTTSTGVTRTSPVRTRSQTGTRITPPD